MFKKNFEKVLKALGLMDKAKSKSLTKEDWTRVQASYKETFGRDFYTDANR